MKIAIVANDFRAYFPPRIRYFGEFLKKHNSSLVVIELFRESICYQFSKDNFGDLPHYVLFEGRYHKVITMSEINLRLRQKLDEIQPDTIISDDVNFPAGAESLHWTRHNRKGHVIFTDSRTDTFKKNAIVMMVKKSLLRGIDAVLCPAPAWDESLMKLGFRQEEIFYGLNSSDNEFWSQPVTKVDFADLPKDYFLHVGRHITQKNLVQFSKAYKAYRNEGGRTPLVLVGEGYTHDDVLKEMAGVDSITFLSFQPREKLRQIYNGARALFLPSYKQETWGMVVNEAMCCGRPIAISEQCGSATTIVKEGVNGFIHSPDDIHAMTAIMKKIDMLSAEEWQRMSDASRNIIQDWGLERFAQGAWDACRYAAGHHHRNLNPIDLIIRSIWNGRIASDDL